MKVNDMLDELKGNPSVKWRCNKCKKEWVANDMCFNNLENMYEESNEDNKHNGCGGLIEELEVSSIEIKYEVVTS